MYLIIPISLDQTDLVESVASQKEYPLWVPTKKYVAGDRVSTPDGRNWVAAYTRYSNAERTTITYNENVQPDLQEGFYFPVGAVITPTPSMQPNPNRLCFWWVSASDGVIENPELIDEYKFLYPPVYQKTYGQDQLSFTLKPKLSFDSIALFGIEAEEVTVTLGSYTVSQTTALPKADEAEDQTYRTDLCFLDLPTYSPSSEDTLQITVSNPGKQAACGYLVAGLANRVGITVYDVSVGIKDYSRKERDVFGNITIIERDFSSTVSFSVEIHTWAVDQARRLLAKVRATPAVYVARQNRLETLVLGFYDSLILPISSDTYSKMTLNVEGLV